jgi:hypothetical protein
MPMQLQRADLQQPIAAAHVGPAPLTIRTVITPTNAAMVGGVPQNSQRGEIYVLLSALPDELRERVKLAVQAIIAGM